MLCGLHRKLKQSVVDCLIHGSTKFEICMVLDACPKAGVVLVATVSLRNGTNLQVLEPGNCNNVLLYPPS
jgi:hypothetical protein